jgi:2-methylcitrate dehydratase PrpD
VVRASGDSLTASVADFIVSTRLESIPDTAINAALVSIADTIAVMFAGCAKESAGPLLRYGQACPAPPGDGVRLPRFDRILPYENAALCAGVLAHALDFDDGIDGVCHPSAVVVPAILAAPVQGPIAGRRAVEAFVIGHEVAARMGRALGPVHAKTWHPTATAGTFGAAAACARIAGLDRRACLYALGLATSMSAGLQRNFGTMAKPLHAGLAARNGVLAVELAGHGFTADPAALDGRDGFVSAYGFGEEEPKFLRRLGQPFALVDPGPVLKRYPCCYATHRPIKAMLSALASGAVVPEKVTSVRCSVPPGLLRPLRYKQPVTGLQGKFSLEYCLAAALLDGDITLASFDDSSVARPAIKERLQLIVPNEDEACWRPGEGRTDPTAEGLIVLDVEGADFTHREIVTYAPGSPGDPFTWEDEAEKFSDCLSFGGFDPAASARLIGGLRNLMDIPDLRSVIGDTQATSDAVPALHEGSK